MGSQAKQRATYCQAPKSCNVPGCLCGTPKQGVPAPRAKREGGIPKIQREPSMPKKSGRKRAIVRKGRRRAGAGLVVVENVGRGKGSR